MVLPMPRWAVWVPCEGKGGEGKRRDDGRKRGGQPAVAKGDALKERLTERR